MRPFAWSCLAVLAACGPDAHPIVLAAGDEGLPPDLASGFPIVDFAAPPLDEDDPAASDDAGEATDGARDGGRPNPCLARASLIYTIDQDNTFSSFSPKTFMFTDIGVLDCPAMNGATPFSMGVDHEATAWVLYSSGEVFLVDTTNAKCTPTRWVPNQNGFSTFGMGFVADRVGELAEHLYIGGTGNRQLGVVDTKVLVPNLVGALNGVQSPELTGNGNAQLWAFFPDAQMPRVAQLDKMTAKEGKTYALPMLAGAPLAWAFAFWGGDFWIFLQRSGDPSTRVYQLLAANGKVGPVVDDSHRTIVGAGVSICAPVTPPTH